MNRVGKQNNRMAGVVKYDPDTQKRSALVEQNSQQYAKHLLMHLLMLRIPLGTKHFLILRILLDTKHFLILRILLDIVMF